MTTLQFLAEWAIRSSVLILTGTLLLWLLRIRDSSIRLAASITMLCASFAIPAVSTVLPRVPVTIERAATPSVVINDPAPPAISVESAPVDVPAPFDWARAAVIVWALVALALLLRLCAGFAMSLRLLRNSRATKQIDIRESDRINAPVTLGIIRPAIVLPADWPQWTRAKLDAVLAHERSHIRRRDPAIQLLSAIHRALLWHSPLSWFLHKQIVRTAEEASDDAALRETHDRPLYAEVLLDFMQRGLGNPIWPGVPMARYGRPDHRINRILDGTTLSRGITKWSLAAILALASPFAYVIAAAHPQNRARQEAAPESAVSAPRPVADPTSQLIAQSAPQPPKPAPTTQPKTSPAYLQGLGSVTPINTVAIKSRIDGQLMLVKFKEGEEVQRGQLLATVDPGSLQYQLVQAEGQLSRDQAQLSGAKQAEFNMPHSQTGRLAQLTATIKVDQATVDNANLQLSYAQIRSPITGVAGLRLVDPGNMVHASDTTGIVVITQLQPIAVLFTIAEDQLHRVRDQLKKGASLPVTAWNRDMKVRFATGLLTAVDNQIDQQTGTAKLKAEFDNKDLALFPGQFVIAQVLLNPI